VESLFVVLVVVGCIAVMVGLGFAARRIRRSGTAGPAVGAAMAAYDEAMHATAHQTFVEVEAQRDRKHATPAPGDPKR
jgi:hypothetical protein